MKQRNLQPVELVPEILSHEKDVYEIIFGRDANQVYGSSVLLQIITTLVKDIDSQMYYIK